LTGVQIRYNFMAECIFCKIVAGEIPAAKIYETNSVLVFLDIHPVSKGHALVVPKEHFDDMISATDEIVKDVFTTGKKVMLAMKEALDADYVAVSVVGIDVSHFHIHLIPRYYEDNLENFWPQGKYEEWEIEKYADKIKDLLKQI